MKKPTEKSVVKEEKVIYTKKSFKPFVLVMGKDGSLYRLEK